MQCCSVCVEEVNNKNIIKCTYCDYVSCKNCFKRYMIDTKKTTKSCMNCNNIYSRGMLVNIFGMSYIEKMYKNHIKELLFNEEKILIPYSMVIVEKNKVIENVKKQRCELIERYKTLSHTLETFDKIKLQHEIKAYEEYIKYLKQKPIEKEKKLQYKYPCSTINCHGFVNNHWACKICDKTTCKYCFKIQEENHECLKDDIDTAELIKKDSKPCPKCNISIIKTSGCDQMWCPSCHTTFDWKTLKIVTKGIIHNPEYFRYMRENGLIIQRNPLDNQCENVLYNTFSKFIQIPIKKRNAIITESLFKQLCELYRRIQHCELITLRNLNEKLNRYEEWKNNIRVKFLEKKIEENQYKRSLARKFKEIDFINEVITLQRTIFEVSKETYIKVLNNIIDNIEIRIDSIYELENLEKFINNINDVEFNKIKRVYNNNSLTLYTCFRRPSAEPGRGGHDRVILQVFN